MVCTLEHHQPLFIAQIVCQQNLQDTGAAFHGCQHQPCLLQELQGGLAKVLAECQKKFGAASHVLAAAAHRNPLVLQAPKTGLTGCQQEAARQSVQSLQ